MKKSRTILLILAIIVIIPSMVYSAAVTRTTAEQVAMNWYSERNDKVSNDFRIVESFIEQENTENIYFIFNFDKTGFVMVSADDATIPILGYVFEHNYTLENHPPQFDAMLASFKEQIVYAKENDISASQEIQNEWNRLNVRTEDFERIRDYSRLGPLLSTIWDQGQYFNEMCPYDTTSTTGNDYVWAGCTATATAQVMKYHTHPLTGEGSHSYTHLTYGVLSANFGATTYNWAAMPNNVTSLNIYVQTLLYHVGVGAEMNYGPTGSGAYIGGVAGASALNALKDYFKYDLNAYHAWKNSYTVPVWHSMLHFELDNNRPLVYAGYNATQTSGHAFVLDGYHATTTNYYHFNWGWSGSYDGYFYLTSLIPYPGYDYTYDQNALFLVEPRKWRPLPDVAIDVSQLPYTGVDLDHYYEGPTALLNYSVVTDLSLEEFALTINANNELVFTENPTVTSDVNIDITIRATYTGGTADDTFNFIITGASSGSTIKWEQLPDTTSFGMDVDATWQPDSDPILLADDFLCTETGYITDIHIWGSWLNDHIPFFEDPAAVQFTFSIHADIPAGPTHSMPGDMLWMRIWIPGPDDVEEVYYGPEDWYNPALPMWLDDNHYKCFKYNYILDPLDYFLQEGTPEDPIIYWLDVQAVPMDPDPECRFGWKTSKTHWNDDAVWINAIEEYIGPWNELRYPDGHEWEGDSIDLAFAITTEEEPEELDFGDAPDPTYPTLLASGARHIIDYQIFMGFSIDAEPDGQPDAAATGDDNDGNDDEDGVIFVNPLYIGQSVNVDVTVSVDGFINAWIDFDIDGGWGEVNDQIFTDVSVAAGTNTLSFTVPASATLGTTFARFRFNMQGGLTFTGLADDGEVEDYRVTIEEEVTYEYDFGDAPEGASAIAYPSSGVMGSFPTCITVGPVGSYIQHGFGENWAWFGPMVDIETDGNTGACPGCFPAYDLDECFQDGDAGLITPDSYTIDATGAVIPCPGVTGSSLGIVCQTATWGVDIDIDVHNNMPCDGFVNVLFDWNQDGQWQNDATTMCAGIMTPEHVLVDFVVPMGYHGPLSGILPPPLSFQIGPNDGYVWARFSITEVPVGTNDWDGSGVFEDGETEDCLLHVEEEVEELDFGDAPDDTTGTLYPTLAINDGARHILDGVTYLGNLIDSELDGQPDATATGDDLANLDDEDGVIFKQIMTGSPAQVIVTTSTPGYLQGWMDFNADGDWTDPNEQIFTDVYIHFASTVCLNYYVPTTATTGYTFARFRFDTNGGLGITGLANNGEVEDYRVEIIEDPDVKWSQLPCEELPGLHCHDYHMPPDLYNVITIADDWQCNGGLVTDIHWWGNYEAVNSGIHHFHLSIHANDPINCLPIDPEIWGIDVLLSQVNEIATGMFNSEGNIIYSYEYILSEPFEQIDSTYYWLDISAFSNDPTNYTIWRWQESSRSTAPILCPAAEKTLYIPWASIVWNTPSPTRYSDMAFEITSEPFVPELEYGDAPEGAGAIAYPSTGVMGSFPTCITVGPLGSYIEHNNFGAYFGPTFDFETDGNAGACPGCFPAYDLDECFNDGDAGLLLPDSYTIDATGAVIPCPGVTGSSLGIECQFAIWGANIDIDVTNFMPSSTIGYVNVLIDWNQDGQWQNDPATQCAGIMTPEHVLVDFPVPNGFSGPLSALGPPNFQIGPYANDGYVWARFSITEVPVVTNDWDGRGIFEDGETEDYLLYVEEEVEELDFGDAPDPSYPTLLANDGARHILDGITYLGAQIDAEPDGQPNADATGDDNNITYPGVPDDEDGVIFTCPLIPGEQGAILVTTSASGYLNAWLDFGIDGSWIEAGDQIFTDELLIAGLNPLNFMVPTTAVPGVTFARFRFDTAGGLGVTGLANDGEVEDYQVVIEENLHDGLKMHYHQWPDTTMFGVDVNATDDMELMRIIADDFLCTETGPVNSIHIWGSYYYDDAPPPFFELGIWSDKPAVPPDEWSEPLTLLWQRTFFPGEYLEQPYYYVPDGEWWYDPCINQLEFPGDWTVWEYDFTIPDTEAFFQEEDTIYWLSVRAWFDFPGPPWFGWKSSVNHWNDDAVIDCMFPSRQNWQELIYPPGHPFNPYGEEHVSMDMAFYIDCHPQDPQNITISKVGTNITLQWDPSWCANYYNVYSSTDPYAVFPSGWTYEATVWAPNTTWSEALNSKKFYRVTAGN